MTSVSTKQVRAPSSAIDGPLAGGRTWSLHDSYDYCREIATSHYENFPVGSILVPKRLRRHFYSIYAFARISDDFADEGYAEGYSEPDRLSWLSRWGEMLAETYSGIVSHPVFVALGDTAERFELPISLFRDLLSAFSQDVRVNRYKTFDELLDYCRRSANPIGRLVLLLFGYKEQRLFEYSDEICTALQLANHWQDVRIDLEKNRIYLPQDDMEKFGVTRDDLKSAPSCEGIKRLLEFEVGVAADMFAQGKPLCTSVGGRLGIELRAVWLGGTTILRRIAANEYDVFNRRPVITAKDKLRILASAVCGIGF
ncbi:MAG: squalene synthase HpnC [Blastocatellia bacterium]